MTEHNPADSSHDGLVESHEFNASNVSCATHTVVHELVSSHSEGRELHHDFNLVILLTFSFASIWCAGKAASKLDLPTLVGEILVGVVLGPPLADLMPVPEALMLFGEVGLMLLVLEAGLDVDFAMLKLIGLRGIAIAVTGSLTPLVLGWLLSSFFLGLEWKARGTAQRTPRRSPANLPPRARAGGMHTPCRHPAHALHMPCTCACAGGARRGLHAGADLDGDRAQRAQAGEDAQHAHRPAHHRRRRARRRHRAAPPLRAAG